MIGRFAAIAEEQRALSFSTAERVAMQSAKDRRAFVGRLSAEQREWLGSWDGRGRIAQLPPDGGWRIWLLMAGRGFGKTRAGAEWVQEVAQAPGLRIALVGPTEDEARAVMVEGNSGLLGVGDRSERPQWEPSLGRLTWPSGSQAKIYSAANPEALRGPEHDFAWCDEIAKWPRAETAWDNLMLGLRRGPHPQALATTTPRPTALMRRLARASDVARVNGRTSDNPLLSESFLGHVRGLYAGTRLGRQELDGELIDDVEGSLWPRDLIERCRGEAGAMVRILVGVDPPAGVGGDACGIVVCGLGSDGIAYVLADASVAGARPDGWARSVANAAGAWRADRIVAEGNQGGAMVENVLRSAGVMLPVRTVHARVGKAARAEPVAGLFEAGRARFAGAFPELEDELAGMTIAGGYEGPGRSPDRADAMVWAMTELMLGRPRGEPRVRML